MKLPNICSDGMILQRGKKNSIWGQALPEDRITLEFLEQRFETLADGHGKWSIELPSYNAENGFGPFEMTIRSGNGEEICLTDILYGDVFLLGGQSNMELPMDLVRDCSEEDIHKAKDNRIRMFQMAKEPDFSGKPAEIDSGEWIPVTPETVRMCSAIGYYFAKYNREWKDVPVGLIHTAVGGAPVESFMSEENLRRSADKIKASYNLKCSCDGNKNMGCIFCYDKLLKEDKNPAYVAEVKKKDADRVADWYAALNEGDPGLRNGWTEKWQQQDDVVAVPGFFKDTPYENYFGTIWLQKTVNVPESMVGSEALLALGTLVDSDKTYVNGELVGETGFRYPPRRYPVRKGLLKPGENVISVRLGMDNNIGGAVPDMPYYLKAGEHSISLEGEWKLRKGYSCDRLEGETFFIWHPTALFQSMIAPLRKISFQAVLFYQGESNCGYPEYYEDLLISMVEEWRSLFGDIPFYMIELAYYLGDGPDYVLDPFTGVRKAQHEAIKHIKDAYLTEIYDLGQYNELHPQNKKEVAERLFALYRKTIDSAKG